MTVDQNIAKFVIRNLQIEDIPKLVPLPTIEGREMGQASEIQTWLNVDPLGIFIAENLDGEIGGCCAGIALSDTHGYVGMYVVKEKYRGVGLGRVLWKAAINRLGDRNVSLSSATKMLKFYREKVGFSKTASWTVDLYTTTVPSQPTNSTFSRPLPFTILVRPGGPFVRHVLDYDYFIHKYNRSMVVKQTIREEGTITLMSVKPSLDERLKATGYASIKKSLQGHWLIAPVYAEDLASARSLVHGLMNTLTLEQQSQGIVAKLVSSNFEAAKLFSQLGMRKTDYQLRRLFTKEVFDIPENKVFALQSSVFCTE